MTSSRLRILLTNNTLAQRAGTELWVRDMAHELLRRGHRPVAYSTHLGEVADELEALSIPVVSDLADLTEPPDLIHGHHHLETMTAALAFPQVPAVYVCHGWRPWQERPPRFPSIARYVAVDDLCFERLVTSGVPPAQIDVILNFVDLDRFRPRRPLPAAPRRALVLSNTFGRGPSLDIIMSACRNAGIAHVDVAGTAVGAPAGAPERLLPDYDVVFARGRSALEALAVGCSVVVADLGGTAGRVTGDNLDELRRLNFGYRSLQRQPITPATIDQALAGYDAADAADVSRRIRAEAGVVEAADRWCRLYEDVLQSPPRTDAVAMMRAASEYVRSLRGLVSQVERDAETAWVHEHELAAATERCAVLSSQATELHRQAEALRHANATVTDELTGARRTITTLTGSRSWRWSRPLRAARRRSRRG